MDLQLQDNKSWSSWRKKIPATKDSWDFYILIFAKGFLIL